MWNGGREIRVAKASKYTKVIKGWMLTVKTIKRSSKMDGLSRALVEKVGSGVKAFNPVGGQQVRLKMKGADDIVHSVYGSFGLPILLGGVRTGKAKRNAMTTEEIQ